VREYRLEIPGFASAAPLRVALLADLHVGSPRNGTEKLREIVRSTNEAHPDLVLLLGDYVIGGVKFGTYVPPETTGEILGDLRAPLGVWAVLGNHDYGQNAPRIEGALRLSGIRVLDDDAVRIELDGANAGGPAKEGGGAGSAFWLVGVSDFLRGPHQMDLAVRQVKDRLPILLFTHNPDLFPEVPERVALTLAGHTHGGQVRLPFFGRLIVPSRYGQRYAAGHVVENGRHLFVATGLGTSIIPVRFLVPPEISILTIGGPASDP
jgi:uncharacterized protein